MSLQIRQCLFAVQLTSSTKTSPLHLSRKSGNATVQQYKFALQEPILYSLSPHRHLCAPLCLWRSRACSCLFSCVGVAKPQAHRPEEQQPAPCRSDLLVGRWKSPGPLEEQNKKQLNEAQTLVQVGFPWSTATTLCILPARGCAGRRQKTWGSLKSH